jgi:quinol monooxygenase YgiN
MIRLNAFIQANPGKADEILAIGQQLVKKSLNDEGCIAYDIFKSGTRSDVLMICETWKDEATLAAHSASAHFTALVPEIEKLGKMKLEQFKF